MGHWESRYTGSARAGACCQVRAVACTETAPGQMAAARGGERRAGRLARAELLVQPGENAGEPLFLLGRGSARDQHYQQLVDAPLEQLC